MRLYKKTLILFVLIYINFVSWDYFKYKSFDWLENLVQAVIFSVLFYFVMWLLEPKRKNKDKQRHDL